MSLTFLDYLECKEIKQAFIRGKIAFVLSSDCSKILWSNGAAAYFFGCASVADIMKEQPFLDQEVHHKILNGAQCANAVVLDGIKRCTEFSVVGVDIADLGKVFLLESFLGEETSLIDGLDNKAMSVAIIDEHGTVLEVSSHFSFVEEAVKTLLKTIDDETSIKTILSIAGVRTQVGIIRLKINPKSFLLLYAPLKSDALQSNQKAFHFKSALLLRGFIWKMDKNGRFLDV
ncbi:hypothetical protein ABID23_000365 [Bartonella silvatica]|uniref:PAS domain-containing protein n=1 Tax=Bartonella silvatica TaxID=357760 RepID=A0ABV2HFF7_9HYPH